MIHLWSWLQVGIDVHATLRLAAKEPLVQITVSRMFFYIYEHFWVFRSSTYWRKSRRRTRTWVQLRVRGGHWLFIHVTKGSSQEQTLHFYFFDLSEQYYYMQVILFSLFFFWNLPKKIILNISSGQQAKKCSKRVFPNILHYGTDGRWYGVGIK